MTQQLILERASASRPSGEWNDDDFDALCDDAVVGRIFKINAAPIGTPWMTPARGPARRRTATRGAAMSAFAKSWRRGISVSTTSQSAAAIKR